VQPFTGQSIDGGFFPHRRVLARINGRILATILADSRE
jgi:hypothetical protein